MGSVFWASADPQKKRRKIIIELVFICRKGSLNLVLHNWWCLCVHELEKYFDAQQASNGLFSETFSFLFPNGCVCHQGCSPKADTQNVEQGQEQNEHAGLQPDQVF